MTMSSTVYRKMLWDYKSKVQCLQYHSVMFKLTITRHESQNHKTHDILWNDGNSKCLITPHRELCNAEFHSLFSHPVSFLTLLRGTYGPLCAFSLSLGHLLSWKHASEDADVKYVLNYDPSYKWMETTWSLWLYGYHKGDVTWFAYVR